VALRAGTFWYHPHHHGSTALQVGGGAAGVLIVEDEDGKVPAALLAMPELVLLTQHLPINTNPNLLSIAQDSADTLTTVDFKTDNADVVLVNGQHLPKLSVTAGKYTRLRVVHSSTASALSLTLDGCELQLLAKDGIYMPTAPRTVTALRLPPGGRCDVALLCRLPGTYTLESVAAPAVAAPAAVAQAAWATSSWVTSRRWRWWQTLPAARMQSWRRSRQ
jgi:FtsP/CotA-like multicopper oxidase with cupredoxin domain